MLGFPAFRTEPFKLNAEIYRTINARAETVNTRMTFAPVRFAPLRFVSQRSASRRSGINSGSFNLSSHPPAAAHTIVKAKKIKNPGFDDGECRSFSTEHPFSQKGRNPRAMGDEIGSKGAV